MDRCECCWHQKEAETCRGHFNPAPGNIFFLVFEQQPAETRRRPSRGTERFRCSEFASRARGSPNKTLPLENRCARVLRFPSRTYIRGSNGLAFLELSLQLVGNRQRSCFGHGVGFGELGSAGCLFFFSSGITPVNDFGNTCKSFGMSSGCRSVGLSFG